MKILKKGFTVNIYGDVIECASKKVFITVPKGPLTDFEKTLLQWSLGIKKDAIHIRPGKRLYYERRPDGFFHVRIREVPKEEDIQSVIISGEKFPVVKDYIENQWLIPTNPPIIVSLSKGSKVIYFYAEDKDFKLRCLDTANVPWFIKEFLHNGKKEVLEKYFPFSKNLYAWIDVFANHTNVMVKHCDRRTGIFEVNHRTGVVTGYAVFKTGIAKLRIPIEYFGSVRSNLESGTIPEEYLDELLAQYEPLANDVYYKLYADIVDDVHVVFRKDKNIVKVYRKKCRAKINGKWITRSIRKVGECMRLAGMVEKSS